MNGKQNMSERENKLNIDIVELMITNECTHHCPYCYANATIDKNKVKHASFETLVNIIREFKRNNIAMVALLGGDPVRHPEFSKIVKQVKDNGMRVSVMSNTMQVANIEEIAPIIDNIDTTLHGRNSSEHDSFCHKTGAYELLIKNLVEFSKYDISINIAINLIPQTYNKVYQMTEAVIKRGVHVSGLLFQRILSYGRASRKDVWSIDYKQVNIALEQAAKLEQMYGIEIRVEDPYPLCYIDPRFRKYMHGCPEGKSRIAVSMEGLVSRCGADPNYEAFNILEMPLEKIWYDTNLFKGFRDKDYLLPDCRECKLLDVCEGGCPICCEQCNLCGKNYLREFGLGEVSPYNK